MNELTTFPSLLFFGTHNFGTRNFDARNVPSIAPFGGLAEPCEPELASA
jgi:hypothetical protein